MLESWRYTRALQNSAAPRYEKSSDDFQLIIEEEWRTQQALHELNFSPDLAPSQLPNIGQPLFRDELIGDGLRQPFVMELAGMPRASKTTGAELFLEDIWRQGKRERVAYAQESATKIDHGFHSLKAIYPYDYAALAISETYYAIGIYGNNPFGQAEVQLEPVQAILVDRGPTDTLTFLRMHLLQGRVNRDRFLFDSNVRPYYSGRQLGAFILCLVRPEVALSRRNTEAFGPVMNPATLQILYEQYLRLHYEFISGIRDVPYYLCLDAEEPHQVVKQKIRKALHDILELPICKQEAT